MVSYMACDGALLVSSSCSLSVHANNEAVYIYTHFILYLLIINYILGREPWLAKLTIGRGVEPSQAFLFFLFLCILGVRIWPRSSSLPKALSPQCNASNGGIGRASMQCMQQRLSELCSYIGHMSRHICVCAPTCM